MKDIYTVEELARLLHRTAREIIREAEKGLLEGRKVQGEWKFSLNAVVAYIGKYVIEGATDDELRDLLERVPEEPLAIAPFLCPETIVIPFTARTQSAVFRDIMAPGINSGRIWDVERMEAAIRKREEMASTAMDNGVALLHPRYPIPNAISETFITLGIAPRGIPFGGGFNNLTDLFFLLCCTDDQTHVRVLAKLGRLMQLPGFLEELREQTSPNGVIDCFEKGEQKLK